MKSRRKSIRIVTIVVIVLILGMGSVATYMAYSVYFRPLPTVSGTQQVAGLHDEATVYRDNWAIPHIYTANTTDLFFVQGYVHAQDRWWQMELSRYLGQGRLHEILPNNDIIMQADTLTLTLGWAEAAQADWQETTPEARAALEAYSAGINAYVEERSVEELASMYGLLGLSGQYDNLLAYLGRDVGVESWEPYHSLLLFKVFAWGMDGNLWAELERASLYGDLEPSMIAAYRPGYPYDHRSTVLSAEELGLVDLEAWVFKSEMPPDIAYGRVLDTLSTDLQAMMSLDLMSLLGLYPMNSGNAWVVSGEHTLSGKPLLANDFQMPIEIPSQWYEMGLHCINLGEECPYEVAGFTLPGIPGIIVGHNGQISWGMNPLQTDTQDVYLLRLNPANPLQYEVDGQWVDMEREVIRLEPHNEDEEEPIEEPLEVVVYRSQYGPIITEVESAFSHQLLSEADYQALALHWRGAAYPADPLSGILALNRAQNWDEFRAALASWRWPAQRFIYADVAGNIGYQIAGDVPIRHADHSGLVPVPGWDSAYAWQGFVPFDLLPSVYNPPDGKIIDADNAVVPLSYYSWLALQLADDYQDVTISLSNEANWGYRATRIEHLLDAVYQHSPDSFTQIQGDNHSLFAQELLPYLFALEFEDLAIQDALDWLKEWDLQNHMDSPQAALFAVFWTETARLTFVDNLAYESNGLEADMWAITQLAAQPDHEWWDDTATPFTHETRDDMLQRAFVLAYGVLKDTLGEDRTEWRWGDLHQGTFISRVIGQDEVLSNPAITSGPFPINRGAFAMSGGTGNVNATRFVTVTDSDDDFLSYAIVTLPTYRLIIDLSDFGQSRAMLATGQSGHPASDNYKDMIVPWRTIEYHDVRWDASDIRERSNKLLELRPE